MNNGPEEINERMEAAVPNNDLTPFETQLRRALQSEDQQDPAAGFADRVLTRAGLAETTPAPLAVASTVPAPGGKLLGWPARRLWITGSLAAALILGALEGGVAWQRAREQERRMAAATAQFKTTERVTMRALAQAREQLQRAGVSLTLD